MTDRPNASTITDAQLDGLYDLLDYLTGCLASTYELSSEEVLTVAREAIDADRRRVAPAPGPAAIPEGRSSRWVHVTIHNRDPYTANRAALSLVDWVHAEFPSHTVTTDAREWDDHTAPGEAAKEDSA